MLPALSCFSGCGKQPPEPADPDIARQALTEALDTWRKGGRAADLEKRTPPVYFNEPYYTAGKRLLRYKINGALKPFGRQLTCTVFLSLRDREGTTEEMDVPYQIDTDKVVVISRDFVKRP
jgi:hypothetical protein